jgi:transcriptional regulator with XRE-family HTH domain
MSNFENINEWLPEKMKEKIISRSELARLSGVSYSQIRKYETGEQKNPTQETVNALLMALGESTDYLDEDKRVIQFPHIKGRATVLREEVIILCIKRALQEKDEVIQGMAKTALSIYEKEKDITPVKEFINSNRAFSDYIRNISKEVLNSPDEIDFPRIKGYYDIIDIKKEIKEAVKEAMGEKEKPHIETIPVSTPYTKKCPHISGNAACGKPFTITDNIVEGHKGYPDDIEEPDFCITAKGLSMLEHGIRPGSVCFIKKVPPSNGDIAAICIYDNGDVYPVLKEVRFKNGTPEFYDGKGEKILMGNDLEVEIIGKVVFITTIPKI